MAQQLTRFEALMACRDAAGSDSQMARDLDVSQPTIWRWIHQSKQMPAEYVLAAAERYSVSPHALRPDIYPVGHPLLNSAPDRFVGIDLSAPGYVSVAADKVRAAGAR